MKVVLLKNWLLTRLTVDDILFWVFDKMAVLVLRLETGVIFNHIILWILILDSWNGLEDFVAVLKGYILRG